MKVSPDVARLNPGLVAEVEHTAPPSKYHNTKTESHGMLFDSGKEAAGVAGLILMEEQKQIFGLRLQVRFPLPGGIVYVADAVYLDEKLQPPIVAFKGFRNQTYIMKSKLFKEKYDRGIEER